MYFKFKCPQCEKSLKVREELAGRKCACPYCKASVRIPQNIPTEPTETESKGPGFPGIDVSHAPKPRGARPTAKDKPQAPSPSPPPEKAADSAGEWTDSSNVSLIRSGVMGGVATVAFLFLIFICVQADLGFTGLFWGWVQALTLLLFFWSLAILVLKWKKLKRQRDSMLLDVLPTELSKEITVDSLDKFHAHVHSLPGEPGESYLINRAIRGLEHFRVRRNAAETVTMMESQSAIDANTVASSYTIVKVFIWAMPIMGFIGTVIGVSYAVASLGGSLENASDISVVKESLNKVFEGLGTAFDTTLLALILSLFVKIPASALQKNEEDLVTWVDEYCNENLLKRLNDGREGAGEQEKEFDPAVFHKAADEAMAAHQTEWKAQMDEMGRVAGQLQETLTGLGERAQDIQKQMASSIDGTSKAVKNNFAGIERGLSGLNDVLERLGEQQVVIRQVKPRRRWFSRRRDNVIEVEE